MGKNKLHVPNYHNFIKVYIDLSGNLQFLSCKFAEIGHNQAELTIDSFLV